MIQLLLTASLLVGSYALADEGASKPPRREISNVGLLVLKNLKFVGLVGNVDDPKTALMTDESVFNLVKPMLTQAGLLVTLFFLEDIKKANPGG